MAVNVLRFSEYRIEYAREISQLPSDYIGTWSLEYGILQMYRRYLEICGFKHIADKLEPFLCKLFPVHLSGALTGTNEDYDEEIVKGINDAIDNILFVHKVCK